MLAILATAIAVGYQRTADDRATNARTARTISEANRLAALSRTARSLDLTLLVAAQAMRTARTAGTEEGLFDALLTDRRATGISAIGGGVDEVVIGPDEPPSSGPRHRGADRRVLARRIQDQPTVLDEDSPWPWRSLRAATPWQQSPRTGRAAAGMSSPCSPRRERRSAPSRAKRPSADSPATSSSCLTDACSPSCSEGATTLGVAGLSHRPRCRARPPRPDAPDRGLRLATPRAAARFATDGSGVLVYADADHRIAWYLDLGTDEVTRLVPDERGVSSYELLSCQGPSCRPGPRSGDPLRRKRPAG